MRILFDSKKKLHKEPFGCVAPEENCTLRIHIPVSVEAAAVNCVLWPDGGWSRDIPFSVAEIRGAYQVWEAVFSLDAPGLYFYSR